MTEKVLLNSGYKYFKDEHPRSCDRYYQKKLAGFDDEPTKFIAIYYYDTFKDDGSLDYKYEYEYIEERNNYWYSTYIWGLDKDFPYTIEEIERMLLGE